MPFGAVFGALFFIVLGFWLVLSPVEPSWLHPVAGRISLACTAVVLAAGLMTRQRWARWAGLALAAGLSLAVMLLGPLGTGTAALMVLFGSLAVAVALALPATGRLDVTPDGPRHGRLGRTLATVALAGAAALGASVVWGLAGPAGETASPAAAAPAVRADRVTWTSYGAGLEAARAEDRPMLVAFVTDWCGYCRKMDRTTWTHPSVVDRLARDVVAVRVDADEAVERAGYKGRDLAARYGVYGYPTVMLIDGDGEVISRTGGYMEPRQFLGWLEGSLDRTNVARGSAAAPSGSASRIDAAD